MCTVDAIPKSIYNIRQTDGDMVCRFIIDDQDSLSMIKRSITDILLPQNYQVSTDECYECEIMVYSSCGVIQPFAYRSLPHWHPKKEEYMKSEIIFTNTQ